MNRVAIIGSNDLGKLIAHHADCHQWEIVGFFDNFKTEGINIGNYGKVLGKVDIIESKFADGIFDFLMIGIGYTQFAYRKLIFEKLKGKIPFGNLIHNSAFVDRSVKLGEGIFILPGCSLDMNVDIEDNVLINTGSVVAHDSCIGKHSFIAPGVTIAGNVSVNECCFVGAGSTIIDNIKIKAKTLIGGGSLVIKDIVEAGTYVGSPVRKIKDNLYFAD